MAYDREHGILVWGGTLPGGEQWTNSLRMAETENIITGNDTAGWDVEALLTHYDTVIQAHHANSSAYISSRAKLTFVKFNRVDVAGHYVDETTFLHEFAPVNGGAVDVHYPNQICIAITLTTAASRGLACKGRIYAPLPVAAVVEADGLISNAAATSIAGAYKTFVEALADVPGVDTANSPGVCVMSKVGSGETRRVNGLRVGRVLDTQRRRRNALGENYVLTTVDQGTF